MVVMTSKMAFGSVSTLAVGGLLLAVLPHLAGQSMGTANGTPWGALADLKMPTFASTAQSDASALQDADRARLLKLASLTGTATHPADASAAAPVANPASPVDTVAHSSDQQTPSQTAMAGSTTASQPTALSSAPSEAEEVAAFQPPTQLSPAVDRPAIDPGKSVDHSAQPAADNANVKISAVDNSSAGRAAQSAVNINTASIEALDHLPGAGRIGHAIAVHRPYRQIRDLVHKRVLRMSDFQKIQSHIRVE